MNKQSSPARELKELLENAMSQQGHLKKKSFRLSWLRLVVFVIWAILIVLLFESDIVFLLSAIILGLSVFLSVVLKHHKVEKEREDYRNIQIIVENEISILEKGKNIYYAGDKFYDSHHYYSNDLDVFGDFSLYSLINRSKTFAGIHGLADIMKNEANLENSAKRRNRVEKLEKDLKWRIEFQQYLFKIENGIDFDISENIQKVFSWDIDFAERGILKIYRRSLGLLWAFLFIGYFWISNSLSALILLLILINFGIASLYANRVTSIQMKLSRISEALKYYVSAYTHIKNSPYSNLNVNWGDVNVNDAALEKLKHISDHLDYRLNLIPSIVLNIGFLWDLRCISRLKEWTIKESNHITDIFSIIGEAEVLVSLSAWSFNNPNYCYANLNSDYFDFQCTGLRHPLMKDSECVPNDFSISKGQFVSVITGSNMSGKSTMLRSVGLNIILGYCGAKCAADSMSVSVAQIVSYMRIKDALEENVSTFKAELNRIAMILELIRKKVPVLVLADEILRGTNSKDKVRGSIAIVRQFIKEECYLMVATHDIGLANIDIDIPDSLQNFYFDIDFVEDELVFDYKIKKGICDNFNASYLLSQLGLDIGEK